MPGDSVSSTPGGTLPPVVCNAILKSEHEVISLRNKAVGRRNSPAALRFRYRALKIHPAYNRRTFQSGRESYVSREKRHARGRQTSAGQAES